MGQEEVYQLVLPVNAFFCGHGRILKYLPSNFFVPVFFWNCLNALCVYYISWLWYMIMVKKYSVAPDAKSVSENQEYQVKMASIYKRDSIA